MNFKKFMAVFVVLIMASASIVVITANVPDSESADAREGGTVVLNVERGYKENGPELYKLGITDPSCWTKTSDGYKVTMENIRYTSNESPAILVMGNGTLTFDCKGINEIKCTGLDPRDLSCAGIVSANDDAALCFTGDGVMNVVCSNQNAIGSVGIYAVYISVKGGCTLRACGSDVTPLPQMQSMSFGIAIDENDGSLVVTEGSTVIARGGDATSNGDNMGACSTGLFGLDRTSGDVVTVKDSTLIAIGGDIKGGDTPLAESAGATINAGISMTNSVVRFYGGTIDVKKSTEIFSIALMVAGAINGVNSEFVAVSGDVSMTTKWQTGACIEHSVGVFSDNQMVKAFNMEGCDCYIVSGSCKATETAKDFTSSSVAFAVILSQRTPEFTMSLEGTIIDFEAGSAQYSYGFAAFDKFGEEPSEKSTIILNDSDMWAYGATQGVAGTIDVVETAEVTAKWCAKSDDGKKWEWLDTKTKPYTSKYISIGFKDNVYVYADYYGLIAVHSYRVDDGTFTLPECEFAIPVGKQFKCWLVGDNEMNPGETITVKYYATVEAVWEDVPGPVPPGPEPEPTPVQSDDTMLIIGGVLVAIIAIFAFAVVWQNTKK